MAGPNTSGLPDTGDYILGRGIIYICPLAASGGTTQGRPWRDLGNATAFSLNLATTKLDHKSSRAGLATIDKSVVTEQKATCKFTLDEVNDENLALFFQGEKATHTNVSIAGFTERQMIASVELGRWYDICNAAGERAYDVLTADLLVEKDAAPDVTLDEGIDYKINSKQGQIFFFATAVKIAAGDPVNVTLTARPGASPVKEVRGQTTTSVLCAIKFVGENPANNDEQFELHINQVQLAPSGDLALIGEQFATMEFEGTLESNENEDADSPYFRTRWHAAD